MEMRRSKHSPLLALALGLIALAWSSLPASSFEIPSLIFFTELQPGPIYVSARRLVEDSAGNVSIVDGSAAARVLVERSFELLASRGPNCPAVEATVPWRRRGRFSTWPEAVTSAGIVVVGIVEETDAGFLGGVPGTLVRVRIDRSLRGDFWPADDWYIFVPTVKIRTSDRCLNVYEPDYVRAPEAGERMAILLEDTWIVRNGPIARIRSTDLALLSSRDVEISRSLQREEKGASSSILFEAELARLAVAPGEEGSR